MLAQLLFYDSTWNNVLVERSPLLFVGVENDGLIGGVVVPLELVAEDALTRVAVKRPTHLLDRICHRHVLEWR